MFLDLIWLVLLLVQALGFSFTIKKLFGFLFKDISYKEIPIMFSFGVVVMGTISAILGVFEWPALWIIAPICLVLQLFGIWFIIKERHEIYSFILRGKRHWLAFILLFFISVQYWHHTLRDVPGMTSYHDGIAHMTFFSRILDSGNPLLSLNKYSLSELFGETNYLFYQTGTHTVVGLFHGLFIKLRWLFAAQAIKTWLIFFLGCLGPMIYWVSFMIFPGRHSFLYFLIGLVGVSNFFFPGWQVDYGGFSLIGAQLIILPLLTGMVFGYQKLQSTRYVNILLIPTLPFSFLLHPSIFTIFVVIQISVLLHALIVSRKDFGKIKNILFRYGFLFFIGAILLYVIVMVTKSNNIGSSVKGLLPYYTDFKFFKPFERFYSLFLGMKKEVIYSGKNISGLNLTTRQVLLYFGLISLFVSIIFPILRIKNYRKVDPPVHNVIISFFLLSFFILSLYYVPYQPVYRLGYLFLHKVSRYLPTTLFIVILLRTLGAILIYEIIVKLSEYFSKSRNITYVLPVSFTFIFMFVFLDMKASMRSLRAHLYRYIEVYKTHTRIESQGMVDYIIDHTKPETLVVYAPSIGDSIEARSGRKGLFAHLECPVFRHEKQKKHCDNRSNLYDQTSEELVRYIEKPIQSEECFAHLKHINRPVVFITNDQQYKKDPQFLEKLKNLKTKKLCKNVVLEYRYKKYSLWRYRKNIHL